jgi:hypothetical protein
MYKILAEPVAVLPAYGAYMEQPLGLDKKHRAVGLGHYIDEQHTVARAAVSVTENLARFDAAYYAAISEYVRRFGADYSGQYYSEIRHIFASLEQHFSAAIFLFYRLQAFEQRQHVLSVYSRKQLI